ncbi:hypothetical protein [Henriciella mobilis]|nr:hypothetical protein [Henriciella mobilis]
MATAKQKTVNAGRNTPEPQFDWENVAYFLHLSRALEDLEEIELVPAR